MDPDYLPFHPNPSRPAFQLPDGAVDAHCHVFGPGAQFPYSPRRKYTPCDAPKDKLFELRDYLGFSKNVIVQASCHGTDNLAMIDALDTAGDLARGVAIVDEHVTEEELARMHQAGVRGVRFNFVTRLVDIKPAEVYQKIAAKIRPFGWHIVVYFEAPNLPELAPFLIGLDSTIVIDHMGRPDIPAGVQDETFQYLLKLMQENPEFWIKVSGTERLTRTPPDYRDVFPFSQSLVENFPDRVLWGTDWPHPNMKSHMPDDGKLVDTLPDIAVTPALQQKLLVENPNRLYWGNK